MIQPTNVLPDNLNTSKLTLLTQILYNLILHSIFFEAPSSYQ